MPVPVPRHSKPYAHPVLKPHNRISHKDQNKVSVPSKGYPTSGPGENWLPAWARTSLRTPCDKVSVNSPAVQDFFPGLIVSGDAAVIKGAHAEAYTPPMHNLLQEHNVSAAVQDFIGRKPTTTGQIHDPNSVFIATDQARSGSQHLWNGGQWRNEGSHLAAWGQLISHGDAAACFTPILEDHSPGSASALDGSSPLEPLTPFTDFVNRAVTTQPDAPPDYNDLDPAACYQEKRIAQEIPLVPTFPSIADVPKQQEQVATTSPTATPGYKKLVEPLSEWIANYIWRVCTTGYSLPPAFQQTSLNVSRHAAETPGHLAPCIQSILLATLLQPSAIYLSLWYMVRLPVYFSAAPLGTELAKAAAFQAAFLGDFHLPHEREVNEHDAPLRLIVLGFMLANKWLDDHTFSNKTWHTISNVPVQTLNALESRAIDAFSYDLSISNKEWSQWLAHVMAHHISLMSPGRPQPISRPSSNPHTIVRRAIEEIIQTPVAPKSTAGIPQPVFLGFEERLREKEATMAVDVLEIDLDEDGPLREEYLPKRRASRITSQPPCHIDSVPVVGLLPPPAKWSPAGDEPIHRERTRSNSQYVAVQAPRLSSGTAVYPLQTHDAAFNQNWLHGVSYVPLKHIGYTFEVPTFFRLGQPAYNSFAENAALVNSHSRSQSLSYNQDDVRMHTRSYSQSGFGYRSDDIHMAVGDNSVPISEVDARWADGPQYSYSGPGYVPIGLQPSW